MSAAAGGFGVTGFDTETNVIAFPNAPSAPSAEVIAATHDALTRRTQ